MSIETDASIRPGTDDQSVVDGSWPPSPTEEGPVYTRSNGERRPLSKMATPHLRSATLNMARDFPGHPELADMQTELARRDAEFAAQQEQSNDPA